MGYRSMLLFLDSGASCARRTQAAIRLARRMDGHLVGLAPTGLLDLPGSVEGAAAFSNLAALAWDQLRDEAERAADTFRQSCRQAGLPGVDSKVDEQDPAISVIAHAHCSDIVLLSQADPAAPDHRAARQLVEQVVLYSARPTLLLPYAGATEPLGQRVLVAWDDSREAARAVGDALPLLKGASSVQVVHWRPLAASRGDAGGLEAVRRWLSRHGVAAEVRVEPASIDIADAMLSHAADLGTDLIVMGAYGHSRWTERVLGGATRGLLQSMTVPVLMSH